MHSRTTANAAAIVACALAIGSTTVLAQDATPPPPPEPPASGEQSGRLEWSAGIDVEHDTNINLSTSDPVSQDVLMPTFAFTYSERGSVLEANAAGHVQYRDYLGGAFSDEFTGTASGVFDWHILPNRLDWMLEDYVGYQPVNVLANNVPNNQQQTNVFVTGPTLRAHFTDEIRGQFDLRYANSYAEQTRDFNGDRLGGIARLIDLMTSADTLTGNLGFQSVRYDNVPDTNNYDRTDAYGSYVRTGPHSRMEADLGYTWLDFKGGAEDHSGIFLRATGRYDFAERTSGTLQFSRTFSDAVQFLQVDPSLVGQVVVGSGLNGALVSPAVYQEDRIAGSIDQSGQTYTLSFAPYWYKDDYLNIQNQLNNTGLNLEAYGLYGTYTYHIQQDLSLGAFAGAERRNYSDLDRTDKDYDFGLALGWTMTQHWAWRFVLSRQIQSTNAFDLSYNGNTFLVGLTYSR
ncbi:MAG TPA: hypothetical protein VFV97_12050 [Rhodanobacteraceae bacterium]|nr:hypothetical protein [Rhodanobacteraceae bacterium]